MPLPKIKHRVEFLKRLGLLYKHNLVKDKSTLKLGISFYDIFDSTRTEFLNK